MNPPQLPKRRVNRQEYLRTLARMTPSQRVMKAFELSEMVKRLLWDGLRHRFPDMSESELRSIWRGWIGATTGNISV